MAGQSFSLCKSRVQLPSSLDLIGFGLPWAGHDDPAAPVVAGDAAEDGSFMLAAAVGQLRIPSCWTTAADDALLNLVLQLFG